MYAAATPSEANSLSEVSHVLNHFNKLNMRLRIVFRREWLLSPESLQKILSPVCAHCTSNKNQHALMLFNGNRFRHRASSVQVN